MQWNYNGHNKFHTCISNVDRILNGEENAVQTKRQPTTRLSYVLLSDEQIRKDHITYNLIRGNVQIYVAWNTHTHDMRIRFGICAVNKTTHTHKLTLWKCLKFISLSGNKQWKKWRKNNTFWWYLNTKINFFYLYMCFPPFTSYFGFIFACAGW